MGVDSRCCRRRCCEECAFVIAQQSPRSDGLIAKFERADGGALESNDVVADRRKHASNLMIATLLEYEVCTALADYGQARRRQGVRLRLQCERTARKTRAFIAPQWIGQMHAIALGYVRSR